jgi:hypothetical protein
MPTIQQVLLEMEEYLFPWRERRDTLAQLRPQNFTSEKAYHKRRTALEGEITELEKEMELLLQLFEREPDRLYRAHSINLAEFNRDGAGTYGDFVFIMTKFPDPKDAKPEAEQLKKLIETVQMAVTARGYKARIAWEKDYTRWLFANVELYLFGCARGIAIVEDKYLPELNPNVAIEWGWMTGMGRQVLYLREKTFGHERADWTGLINYTFDWNDPKQAIEQAVNKFLPQKQLPSR